MVDSDAASEISATTSFAASESSVVPSVRRRIVTWAALAAIVAGYATVDVVFNPIGTDVEFDENPRWVVVGALSMGMVIAQPILAAIVAVFWPTPAIYRISLGTALALLQVYAIVLTQSQQSNPRPDSVLAPLMMFLAFQLPLWILRTARGWRLTAPASMASKQQDARFGLRALLVVVTVASALFAAGRWALAPIDWQAANIQWSSVLQGAAFFAFFSAFAFLAIVPAIAWALGTQRRLPALLATLVCMVGLPTGLSWLEASQNTQGVSAEEVVINVSVVVGAYGSLLIALFVLRWCGYRLTRERRGSPPPAGSQLPDAATAVG